MYSGHSSHTNPELGVDPDEPEDITEAVCLESALQDGQMMEVEVGHHNVLLAKCDGVYHAVGNQCTHYGGPLSKGALMGNKIRCPWHGSCFSVLTGDMEEFPAMDGLPKHKVKVEDSKVYVSINKKNKRMKKMCGRTPGNAHTIMLLGGGSASLICAETLRQEKYDGRIIMVTRDDLMPYDKTRLSKVMNAESSSIMLRKHEFYHQYDIEMWLRKEALSINTEKQTVTFNDGITQCYDQLLIATGCRAKPLDIPGADLEDVMMLEVPADAQRVHYACIKRRIVLVGTSFVGMEIAAYMIDRASSITVIGSSEMPYHKTFGPEIGKFTMTLLEEKGVKFYMNDFVKEIRGEDKKVKDIVLKSGTIIPTDVVIVGIGVLPNSECLQGSDVILDAKRFVPVDKYMRTNVPNVFCGGDVSTFPLKMANDQRVNIGHWQQAQAHGRVAALNMLQKEVPLNSVPVYWTVLLGMTIRYAGFGEGYTELEVKGNVKEMKFLALYIKEDRVVAAASLNFDPAVSVVAERLATGNTITKAEAKSDDLAWLHLPDPHQS